MVFPVKVLTNIYILFYLIKNQSKLYFVKINENQDQYFIFEEEFEKCALNKKS